MTAPAGAADYEDGMTAYEAGDYERAAQIWVPLAESGDPTAQYSLGKIYETGSIALPRNYGQAIEWYRLASAQGVAAAQNNLGLMYAQGRGVARDPGRAVELWSAAAEQDHPMAQFNLGLAYFRGEGVAEDKRQAETWFRRAAELGLADAQYALGQISLHGLTADTDRGEALAWYQLAAAQGHTKAREQAEILRQEGVKPKMKLGDDEATAAATAPATAADMTPAVSTAEALPKTEPAPMAEPAPKTEPAPMTAPGAMAEPGAKPTARSAKPEPSPGAEPAPQAAAPETAPMPSLAPAAGAKSPAPQASAPPPAASKPAAPKPAALKPAGAEPAQPAAQVARATPPTKAGAGAAGQGRVRVWLYSADSEVEAIGYLRRVEERHGDLMANAGGAVMPIEAAKGGVLYRVVAGHFEDWNAGRAWCRSLQSAAPGTFCKVLPSRPAAN